MIPQPTGSVCPRCLLGRFGLGAASAGMGISMGMSMRLGTLREGTLNSVRLGPLACAPPSRGLAGMSLSRKRPDRLQLSDRVAFGTPSSKPDRKQSLYPTGGLNQREANIPPARRPPARRGAKNAKESTSTKPGRDKRPNPQPGFKHLKMAQSLERVSLTHKQKVRDTLDEDAAFSDYPLLPTLQEALTKDILSDLEIIRPSPVQRLAIPALLANNKPMTNNQPQRFLIAAETGSGKTLAYLLPLMDHIKRDEVITRAQEEEEKKMREAAASPNEIDLSEIEPPDTRPRPRALILVPTSELVAQVGSIVKKLSHNAKFRAVLLSREFSGTVIRSRLSGRPDVVITTPHLFASIAMKDPAILSECRYIVADEADSLFDRSFIEITDSILVRATQLQQLVLCSATIPTSLDKRLRRIYPDITRLVTPNIHAIPRRVQMSIVDIDGEPYNGNKMLACADILYSIAKDEGEPGYVKKAIVFVNQREATAPLAEYLRSKGIHAMELDRDSASRVGGTLEFFVGPKTEVPQVDNKPTIPRESRGRQTSRGEPQSARKVINLKVLVTTDISSRGIDTKTVKNIILYDVPYSTVDFIHRMGRAGRMGRRGRAVVLVDRYTNKAWVREVKTCMHAGAGLL